LGFELFLYAVPIGCGHGGVQLDQHLPCLDAVAVFDQHGFDHAGFQRLDDFGAVADDDAPRRYRHNVHMAEDGPQERQHKENHQPPCQTARGRVNGGVLQAQGGGQKGQLAG
jgi:hypothetical protein